MKLIFACLTLITIATASKNHADVEIEAFTKAGLTPDVIPVAPSKLIKVEFRQSKTEALLGNKLTPKDVQKAPSVLYKGDSKAFYTLIMFDPDAPSRKTPTERSWVHWLVVNIPGSDVSKGQIVDEYIRSLPPKDSGYHRYTILLYKQPGKVEFHEEYKNSTNGKRGKFSVVDFAKKYNLGNPVAGNFYLAEYDDTVPSGSGQVQF